MIYCVIDMEGGCIYKRSQVIIRSGCRNSLHCCLFVGVYVCVFEWEFLWRHKHLRQFLNNDDRSVSWEGGMIILGTLKLILNFICVIKCDRL